MRHRFRALAAWTSWNRLREPTEDVARRFPYSAYVLPLTFEKAADAKHAETLCFAQYDGTRDGADDYVILSIANNLWSPTRSFIVNATFNNRLADGGFYRRSDTCEERKTASKGRHWAKVFRQ